VNKDKLKLWIDALRSGKFEQGQGNLASRDGEVVKYCCLGVACEVAVKDGLDLEGRWGRPIGNEVEEWVKTDHKFYDSEDLLLPPAVQDWLGIPGSTTVEVMLNGIEESVIDLNDNMDRDFGQIADALEWTFLKEEK
jgi:hypothetical protein